MKKKYILIPLIAIIVVVGGSMLTNMGMVRYATLNLHPLTPPGALIGMVWTFIFICTTLSALSFWKDFPRGKIFTWITRLFIANAVLNVLRSWIFFVNHWSVFAFVEMIVLWLVTFALFLLLMRKNRISAWLLLPYLIWVILASFFAYQVIVLN
ncbi:MAG: tryptophan-rich sensory protein [candidate division SR1 bacterium]|nr:tryptophan-rich sensory protein [candidate division SR1 bacterium]